MMTIKKILIFSILFFGFSRAAFSNITGIIHTTQVVDSWCGNLIVSTKVGKFIDGACHYEKESEPYGYDNCWLSLNGGLLEDKVGTGYACAAVHVRSSLDGKEAQDEFQLRVDQNGHYLDSQPRSNKMKLEEIKTG